MATFRVEPAEKADMTRLMQIVIPAFEDMQVEQLMENTSARAAEVERRHLRAWAEHRAAGYRYPMGYKCVLTGEEQQQQQPKPSPNPSSGGGDAGPVTTTTTTTTDTIVASAYWVIYDRPRPQIEYERVHYLFSGEWVADVERRAIARAAYRPFMEARVRWNGGRPYALLIWMATDPAFRRRGAATACVRYGIERCRELGIPAYLEASAKGRPVYEALGFEVVEDIAMTFEGKVLSFPAMMWWPPGYPEEKRKPALPDFRMTSD